MAKKGKINRNNRKAELIARYRELRKELKQKMYDYDLPDEERAAARKKLLSLPKDSNPIRYRNRCQISGRPRGYLRRFAMSRIAFRELANFGLLPGVTKSSF